MTTEATRIRANAVAILRAATWRKVGVRRWGPGGGHLASYYPAHLSSTGWRTFSWREPDRTCRVDLARHRNLAKAEARKIIERVSL